LASEIWYFFLHGCKLPQICLPRSLYYLLCLDTNILDIDISGENTYTIRIKIGDFQCKRS
jgi:hypothetical protein